MSQVHLMDFYEAPCLTVLEYIFKCTWTVSESRSYAGLHISAILKTYKGSKLYRESVTKAGLYQKLTKKMIAKFLILAY